MKKLYIEKYIEKCGQCCYSELDKGADGGFSCNHPILLEKYGYYKWIENDGIPIPKWCPLPDDDRK